MGTLKRLSVIRAATVAIVAAVTLGVVGCGGGGGGGPENIRLTVAGGHPAGGAIDYTTWSQEFFVPELKQRVEAETDHTIEITEGYGGSIAELADLLEVTGDGLVDIGMIAYPFEPSKLFMQNVSYYVPMQSPDLGVVMEATRATFDENPELKTMLEDQFNQKLLGLGGWGDYNLLTTFDWNTIDELQGRKIAAAGPNVPWLEPVDVTPVQSDLNEAYTSMQTGVYEGWVMFPESTAGFRLYEVAPYYTLVNYGAVAATGIHVNLDAWEDMPEDVQTILQEVALEYEATIPEVVQEHMDEAMLQMEQGGATIKELPEEEREAYANAFSDLPNQRAQEANDQNLPGSKAMQDYIDFMEEEGYEFPREWTID